MLQFVRAPVQVAALSVVFAAPLESELNPVPVAVRVVVPDDVVPSDVSENLITVLSLGSRR